MAVILFVIIANLALCTNNVNTMPSWLAKREMPKINYRIHTDATMRNRHL